MSSSGSHQPKKKRQQLTRHLLDEQGHKNYSTLPLFLRQQAESLATSDSLSLLPDPAPFDESAELPQDPLPSLKAKTRRSSRHEGRSLPHHVSSPHRHLHNNNYDQQPEPMTNGDCDLDQIANINVGQYQQQQQERHLIDKYNNSSSSNLQLHNHNRSNMDDSLGIIESRQIRAVTPGHTSDSHHPGSSTSSHSSSSQLEASRHKRKKRKMATNSRSGSQSPPSCGSHEIETRRLPQPEDTPSESPSNPSDEGQPSSTFHHISAPFSQNREECRSPNINDHLQPAGRIKTAPGKPKAHKATDLEKSDYGMGSLTGFSVSSSDSPHDIPSKYDSVFSESGNKKSYHKTKKTNPPKPPASDSSSSSNPLHVRESRLKLPKQPETSSNEGSSPPPNSSPSDPSRTSPPDGSLPAGLDSSETKHDVTKVKSKHRLPSPPESDGSSSGSKQDNSSLSRSMHSYSSANPDQDDSRSGSLQNTSSNNDSSNHDSSNNASSPSNTKTSEDSNTDEQHTDSNGEDSNTESNGHGPNPAHLQGASQQLYDELEQENQLLSVHLQNLKRNVELLSRVLNSSSSVSDLNEDDKAQMRSLFPSTPSTSVRVEEG